MQRIGFDQILEIIPNQSEIIEILLVIIGK